MGKYIPISEKDIVEFLEKHKIVLNETISDWQISDGVVNAEIYSLNNKEMYDSQISINVNDTVFDGMISYPYQNSRNTIESKSFNYSLDWIKFRCSKYPEMAELIMTMAEELIKEKQEETNNQISNLEKRIKEIKAEEQAVVNFLEKCIKIAKSNISESSKQPQK